jgi:hypothetical protein
LGISLLEQVKDALTIVQASEMAGIKFRTRRGNAWMAHCPFHEDNSPSFAAYLDSNRWQCFGCNTNGDQIDLVAKMRGQSIKEALNQLATELGISSRNYIADESQRKRIEEMRQKRLEYRKGQEIEWAIGKAVHYLRLLENALQEPLRACRTAWEVELLSSNIHLLAKIDRILDDLISQEKEKRERALLSAWGVIEYVKDRRDKRRKKTGAA